MNAARKTAGVRGWVLVVVAGLCLAAGLVAGRVPGPVQAQTDEPTTQQEAAPPPAADREEGPADRDAPAAPGEPPVTGDEPPGAPADADASGPDAPDRDASAVPDAPETPNAEAADPNDSAAAGQSGATVRSRQVTMPRGANVAVIRIEGMIYGFTKDSLERRVDRALARGADVIVIEIHTNGGTVPAGMEIAKYIKSLPVYTVAWINNKAYSAGILIASAANEIVMASHSATGDCAPIVPGQELAASERAKALSPILEEFRDNAATNNYDYALFQAMCVLGVEAYLIEDPDTGERKVVNQVDYAIMVRGEDIDAIREQLAQYTAEERVGMASINVATEAESGRWQLVDHIHDGNTLLTMSHRRAIQVGLASAEVSNEQDLEQHLGAASLARIEPTWSERLVGFLTNPVVRGVLVIALLLGGYIEFQTPGVGVAGSVALLALALLLGAPFLVGLAEVWHILVFLIGLGLLIVELLWMPGFGFIGIGGVVLMFVGLVLSAVPTGGGSGFGPVNLPPQEMWGEVLRSSLFMMLGVFASFIGFYFITRHFGRIPGLSRLILEDAQPAWNLGDGRAMPMPSVSGDESLGGGQVRIGDAGRVTVELRPTGRAEINGTLVDVVSYGRWIEPGAPVRVVEVHGNRIVVDTVEG